ncbi:MAG: hypothetical protein IPH28_04070 [Cytophagaceae bacterium]|nr:hypothetical protein [Cytophagaceae bacterium]
MLFWMLIKKANEQNVNVIDIIPSPNEQFEAEYPMLKIKGEYYCMGAAMGIVTLMQI